MFPGFFVHKYLSLSLFILAHNPERSREIYLYDVFDLDFSPKYS